MESTQLAVVGGGIAGASAAIQAANSGLQVTLIDEHPIDFSMMGLDIPFLFGQRMIPSLRDKGLTLQRVVSSNQPLSQAQDSGVNVLPGTYVWGSFRNQENSRQLDKPLLGLANDDSSWLLQYDRLILAPGARDLVFAFPGRELVGVVGASAVRSLLSLYQGLTAKSMVILGSGDLTLSTALLALDHGVQVPAIIDISPNVRGNPNLKATLESRGVRFYLSHTVKQVTGHREAQAIIIVKVDKDYQPVRGTEQEVPCDTVCLAFGLVPSVELPYLTGCSLSYEHSLGGFVPVLDEDMQTSIPGVYVAGDAAGFQDSMASNPNIARAQGRLAAIAASRSLGAIDSTRANSLKRALAPAARVPGGGDAGQHRSNWLSSLVAAGGMNVNVCQCEEVTRRELLSVAAPRYLKWPSDRMGDRSIETLLKETPPDLDRLKRLTRAGMGYCQGRRCREEIALLVAQAANQDVSRVPIATYRPPVRPLPLKVLWPQDETQEFRDNWYYWIKIPPKTIEDLKKQQQGQA